MAFKFREHILSGMSWHDIEKAHAIQSFPNYVTSQSKVVISDCDGILTDSKSLYTQDGKFAKTYGAYDKEMMELMLDIGWRFIFVTTDKAGAKITDSRLAHLEKMSTTKISHQVLGARERAKLVAELMANGCKVLFVGDSLSDIESLNVATWAATTANAPDIVKRYCDYVSEFDGGSGGFADILYAIHTEIIEHPSRGWF
jgi:3-deoxy-D-manno-octulosonate 8-phosphate phosphatase (KDO 8-P phosphatase)